MLVWAAPALLRRDGAVLLRRRGDRELFAGLSDLPSSGVRGQGAAAAARSALSACGISGRLRLEPCGEVRQILTHRDGVQRHRPLAPVPCEIDHETHPVFAARGNVEGGG